MKLSTSSLSQQPFKSAFFSFVQVSQPCDVCLSMIDIAVLIVKIINPLPTIIALPPPTVWSTSPGKYDQLNTSVADPLHCSIIVGSKSD